MSKFATKIVSQQNSVNQFGIQIHILGVLFGVLGVLFDILGVLVGVLVLFGVPGVFWRTGVLVGVLGVWWFVRRTLYICWCNWCLWHWDVVFVTFRIWGASIFITKNVFIR